MAGFWRCKQVYLSNSEPTPIRRTAWGWSLHSPGSAARDSSMAAWLNTPGMWMAGSDLRYFWPQRRRWQASCDMRQERNGIASWYTQRSSCCPYGPECPCLECALWGGSGSGVLLGNLRQVVFQRSWGPVYSLDTECPLTVAPKPVAKASVSNTVCPDTCSRGPPARRNEGSPLSSNHLCFFILHRTQRRPGWTPDRGRCRGTPPCYASLLCNSEMVMSPQEEHETSTKASSAYWMPRHMRQQSWTSWRTKGSWPPHTPGVAVSRTTRTRFPEHSSTTSTTTARLRSEIIN